MYGQPSLTAAYGAYEFDNKQPLLSYAPADFTQCFSGPTERFYVRY